MGQPYAKTCWPAPGSKDTELDVFDGTGMKVYAGAQGGGPVG